MVFVYTPELLLHYSILVSSTLPITILSFAYRLMSLIAIVSHQLPPRASSFLIRLSSSFLTEALCSYLNPSGIGIWCKGNPQRLLYVYFISEIVEFCGILRVYAASAIVQHAGLLYPQIQLHFDRARCEESRYCPLYQLAASLDHWTLRPFLLQSNLRCIAAESRVDGGFVRSVVTNEYSNFPPGHFKCTKCFPVMSLILVSLFPITKHGLSESRSSDSGIQL